MKAFIFIDLIICQYCFWEKSCNVAGLLPNAWVHFIFPPLPLSSWTTPSRDNLSWPCFLCCSETGLHVANSPQTPPSLPASIYLSSSIFGSWARLTVQAIFHLMQSSCRSFVHKCFDYRCEPPHPGEHIFFLWFNKKFIILEKSHHFSLLFQCVF